MAENSAIEWCDHTFNPWIGCTKVSPACDHCYAEELMATRYGKVEWGGERVRTGPATWAKPRTWERRAAAFFARYGRLQRVFCASLADWCDRVVWRQVDGAWHRDLAKVILATPSLEWLLLTKRIGVAVDMLLAMFPDGVPDNVRVGATIANQEEADRDLRKVRAVARICALKPFLSMEPLLGPVDLGRAGGVDWHRYVGWVIVGGESGRKARPMHPDWLISLRDQCHTRQVPFLFKQWGEILPVHVDTITHTGFDFRRVGKKAAGRRLHGVEENGFPVDHTATDSWRVS